MLPVRGEVCPGEACTTAYGARLVRGSPPARRAFIGPEAECVDTAVRHDLNAAGQPSKNFFLVEVVCTVADSACVSAS